MKTKIAQILSPPNKNQNLILLALHRAHMKKYHKQNLVNQRKEARYYKQYRNKINLTADDIQNFTDDPHGRSW